MWLLSLIGGTVGRWLLVGGLSLALIAGAYGGGYLHGQINSKNAAEVRQLEATVEHLQAEIARREARTAADNEARERDRDALERLEEANRILQNELEDPDRECLGPRDTDRLRQLWD